MKRHLERRSKNGERRSPKTSVEKGPLDGLQTAHGSWGKLARVSWGAHNARIVRDHQSNLILGPELRGENLDIVEVVNTKQHKDWTRPSF